MKNMSDITLYDLMAEDLDVWVSKGTYNGFNLEIDDENGEALIREQEVHRCAAESLADFCRSYLSSYEKIEVS